MKIDVDCPGCGKRYEVDESLAGKKSRCKDCSTVFSIPLGPSAPAKGESSRRPGAARLGDSSSRSLRQQASPAPPAEGVIPASPPIIHSGAARGTIVLNCPRCFKRYEVDAALTGKKSRCKDCKEVFTIQAPLAAPVSPPSEPAPPASKPSLGARNFAVIPEEVLSHFEEVLEFEPAKAVRGSPPLVLDEEEPLEFGPRRVAYPERAGRSKRRENVDTEVGVTVAGAYGALGILAFIMLAIWHAAGEPGSEQLGRVFGACLMIMYVLGLLMATWANIWLLVIAFRDKLEQGLLCLLVPCYAIFYIFSRWRETRGIFAMCFAPSLVLISFAMFGGLVLGVAGPLAFVNGVRDRLESLAPETSPTGESPRIAEAQRVYRVYIQAMNRYAEELSRVQSVAPGQLDHAALDESAQQVASTEARVRELGLTQNERRALKKTIGAEIREAVIALKYQLKRLDSLPGMRGRFDSSIAGLDRMLAAWDALPDADTGPQLVEEPPPLNLAPNPRPNMSPGGMPPGGPPRGFESFETHYDRLRSQYGDKAVMVVVTGLPINSDPAAGVTKRDVDDAIDKKLKVLVPGATQSMSTGSGDRRSICLAPVDDVKGLANAIDFGKASWKGSRIDVVVSRDYIASVPRLPAEPSLAVRPPAPREKEPEIQANADPVTRSLIQLKSENIFQKKEAVERLARIRPTGRLKEVLADILPLFDHDDEDLVKKLAGVLAVWQSPEAMEKLIHRVSDSRVFVRWEVMKALAKYDDAKAVDAIIGRLKEDGHQAGESLKTMGSLAEPPLIQLLINPDADLRRKACEVLKFVGGPATLKAMRGMRPDIDVSVRNAAQETIRMINLRVGPAPSDAPETKKAAPPPPTRTRKKS